MNMQRPLVSPAQQQMLAVRVCLRKNLPVNGRRATSKTPLRAVSAHDTTAEHPLMLGGQTMNGMSLRHPASIGGQIPTAGRNSPEPSQQPGSALTAETQRRRSQSRN